jgi:hypothetical protein
MRRKQEAQIRARELRQSGWPLRPIANELGVALSSVSVWVRDIRPQDVVPDIEETVAVVSGPEFRIECGRCKAQLPERAFSRHPTRGRQHWCKACFSAYFRARGSKHRKQSSEAKRRRQIRARGHVAKILAASRCTDCGLDDSIVLEFDHIRKKSRDISFLVAHGWSTTRIDREIAHCEIVCVNCHRRRTHRRAETWRCSPGDLDKSPHLVRGERRNLQLVRDVLLQSRCVDCSESDLLVLEFDHVGTKRDTIPAMARRGCSFARLKREIAECEVRCANCHRRRTKSSVRTHNNPG